MTREAGEQAACAATDVALCSEPARDALTITAWWTNQADIDLWLTTPSGRLISDMSPAFASVTGGRGGCDTVPGASNERISIGREHLEAGPYFIEAHMSNRCASSPITDVNVAVLLDGQRLEVLRVGVELGATVSVGQVVIVANQN